MADGKSPSSKVYFFKHFPHYFLRPYDAHIFYDEKQFLDKLNPKNCEWLNRPKIAMSECAMGITENWKLLEENNLFSDEFMVNIRAAVEGLIPNWDNLNSKNPNANPTAQDVYNLMNSCFHEEQFDIDLGTVYQKVGGMFTLLSQLRAFRGLVRNPGVYAGKLTDDSPASIKFKTDNDINGLQTMFQEICAPATQVRPTPTTPARNLAQQLVNQELAGHQHPPHQLED